MDFIDFTILVWYFLIIIPSSIIHEYAHGWMADQLGDPTARYAGRLTMDPRAHIDLWGTILMPLILFFITMVTSGRPFLFAYAKPVPFNPYNLRNQRWGPALVGLAGPMANFLLAASFAALVRLFPDAAISEYLKVIVSANLLLMVFNLVPLPPLDGSKILFAILPDSMSQFKMTLERYGFFILIFFVFVLFRFISPIIDWLFSLLVGQPFF